MFGRSFGYAWALVACEIAMSICYRKSDICNLSHSLQGAYMNYLVSWCRYNIDL
jgi:hypothetical protein